MLKACTQTDGTPDAEGGDLATVAQGDGSIGEFYSVALTNNYQQAGKHAQRQEGD